MMQDEPTAVRQIPIHQIQANPHQPRHDFNEDRLEELADSIRSQGIIQPIILRKTPGNFFEIVAGERRWRAAQIAGLKELPSIIREYDDRQMMEAAIIENVQRDDLNAVDEALAYESLIDEFGLKQDAVAKTVGKSRVTITNALRLLKLPEEVLDMIRGETLSAGHARALLALNDKMGQVALAKQVAEKGLSVREVERRVKQPPKSDTASSKRRSNGVGSEDEFHMLEERLVEKLGMKVKLSPKTNTSGKVEVYYSSLDEFQQFCERLLGVTLDKEL